MNNARVRINELEDGSKTVDVDVYDGPRLVCALNCTTETVAYDLATRINSFVNGVETFGAYEAA